MQVTLTHQPGSLQEKKLYPDYALDTTHLMTKHRLDNATDSILSEWIARAQQDQS